ncbi:hypothetical protein [Microbacterium sp.]|uniref:hypothetical protein n=1 Tax=Microbacterium sp. TaxID=51671 RepID=UPI00373623C8
MTSTSADVVISDDEILLRALEERDFGTLAGLKWQAFAPPSGKSAISIMRLQVLGPDAAKAKGLQIKPKFAGFARARAGSIRLVHAHVTDEPDDFVGHAHLDHGFPRPPREEAPPLAPGEPSEVSPEYLRALKHFKTIAGLFCYFADTAEKTAWTGADLEEVCASVAAHKTCIHPMPSTEPSA